VRTRRSGAADARPELLAPLFEEVQKVRKTSAEPQAVNVWLTERTAGVLVVEKDPTGGQS
jgi:hypothetical protein